MWKVRENGVKMDANIFRLIDLFYAFSHSSQRILVRFTRYLVVQNTHTYSVLQFSCMTWHDMICQSICLYFLPNNYSISISSNVSMCSDTKLMGTTTKLSTPLSPSSGRTSSVYFILFINTIDPNHDVRIKIKQYRHVRYFL